jgi:hypothetical protein
MLIASRSRYLQHCESALRRLVRKLAPGVFWDLMAFAEYVIADRRPEAGTSAPGIAPDIASGARRP